MTERWTVFERCTCGKVAYPSFEAARNRLAYLRLRRSDLTVRAFYECDDVPGAWHLTSCEPNSRVAPRMPFRGGDA